MADVWEIVASGRDDIRDGTFFIGFLGTKPIFYEIDTQIMHQNAQTIFCSDQRPVARLDWAGTSQLGTVTIPGRPCMNMTDFLEPGSQPHSRRFWTYDGRQLEWRSVAGDGLDLYSAPTTKLGSFRVGYREVPEIKGKAHATLYFRSSDNTLLLDVLISLCILRWFRRNM